MKKFLLAALWLPLMALAQSYPSPTYQNLTVLGTLNAATPAFTNPVPVSSGGTGRATASGTSLDNITGFASTGYIKRTGAGTYAFALPIPVSDGGTNATSASGTALDNITGFASTGFLTRTGAGAYAFQSLTNGITLGNLATQAANTVLANATGSTAGPTAFSMPGCSAATNALTWTTSTGFTCNSSITAAAVSANALTNAMLAQAAAYTEKCNPNSTTGNVTDCNRPNLNVEDFGVKGDNATDNSAAMGTVVTACLNLGGCNIHFSSKTGNKFLMHGVQIASGNVNFVCEQNVILVNNSTNTYAIQFGNGSTQTSSQGIYGCLFGQATGVTPTSGNVGLSLNYVGSFRMHDVTALNFPAALYNGISVYKANQSFMDGVNVLNSVNTGILLNGGGAVSGGDLYISNSHSDANGADGWALTDYGGVYFTNVSAYANTGSAFDLYKTSTGNNNIFFSNCIGDTSGSYNWNVSSLIRGYFSNVWGSTQLSTTTNTFATGFIFTSNNVSDILMSNVVAVSNNSHGISIVNGGGGMPQNITILNPQAGSTVAGSGNGRASGGGYGIWVDNAASNITIIGGESVNNASGALLKNGASVSLSVSKMQGFNPQLGSVAQPAIAASGTAVTNTTGVDCMVYIVGGTVTGINVGGAGVLLATPAAVLVPANKTITLTYSSAPTWQWSGL